MSSRQARNTRRKLARLVQQAELRGIDESALVGLLDITLNGSGLMLPNGHSQQMRKHHDETLIDIAFQAGWKEFGLFMDIYYTPIQQGINELNSLLAAVQTAVAGNNPSELLLSMLSRVMNELEPVLGKIDRDIDRFIEYAKQRGIEPAMSPVDITPALELRNRLKDVYTGKDKHGVALAKFACEISQFTAHFLYNVKPHYRLGPGFDPVTNWLVETLKEIIPTDGTRPNWRNVPREIRIRAARQRREDVLSRLDETLDQSKYLRDLYHRRKDELWQLF